MRALLTMIAAMLLAGSAAFAEPPKSHASVPAPRKVPAEVVLASADTARPQIPATVKADAPPAKRRPARVTACRCGDPAVEPETEEQ